MMKKIGYRSYFAGAVEAVASTGGALMPPVMGAAVFIMSEYTGIPYLQILKHALLPALLYYVSIFFMVHLEAAKTGIGSLAKDAVYIRPQNLWKQFYLFTPLVVIVAVLVKGYSPMYAVLISLAAIIVIASFRKATRMGISKIASALIDGVHSAIGVAMACAAAGIVVGIASYTGLGLRFTSFMLSVADSNLLFYLQ